MNIKQLGVVTLTAAIVLIGSGSALAQDSATPKAVAELPANFADAVTHPYLPLTPGTTYVFAGSTESTPIVEQITVESERKEILGVSCTVVHHVSLVDGEVVEDTEDWFAQDAAGNVWYFGEESRTIVDGDVVDTHGSWEAGRDGASAGIMMPAETAPSEPFYQEYFEGEAEDVGQIVEGTAGITIGTVTYDDVVVTHEWSALEPGVVEEKVYARSVGLISATALAGEDEHLELVAIVTSAD